MQIRIAEPDDAPAIVEFLNVLYLETEYMLFEDGEFTVTSEQQRKQIETRTKEGTGVIFLCLREAKIVGILFGMRSNLKRICHTLYLVLGVLREYHRQGIGCRLMTEVIAWAESREIRRMELNVDVRNTGAIELYEKMGFQVEGLRRRARRFGDVFVDEHTMGRLS
jgi:ribosomal protein S18 acetylase RimI-like enzyme